MELSLTDDQQFFRETTRRFLRAESSSANVRRLRSNDNGFDQEYWRQGAELGWTSLLVPDSVGGGSISGEGLVDLTLVAEEFGRHAAPGPLVATNVLASTLARSGDGPRHASDLSRVLSGDLVAAWCGSEQAFVGEPITATPVREGHLLAGTTTPVEFGAQAEQLLVTARSGGGLVQYLLPADAPGVEIERLESLDLTRRYARVAFNDVRVGEADRIGEGDASVDVERQLQEALVIQTAEMVGAAQQAFDMTVEWAFDRYTFGRPLASYQELKHRFADMKTWLEASHALVSALAHEVQDGAATAAETASAAKAYIGPHLSDLLQDCVQIHGGIGLTDEHDLHLFLRRVVVGTSTYGTPADHRERLASRAFGEVPA